MSEPTQQQPVIGEDTDRSRYEAHLGDRLAGVITYVDDADGNRVLQHTVVGEEFGGRGVAGALTAFALQDAEASGRKIVPQCTYVQGWLEKHPEQQQHVAHAYGA